MVIDRLTGFYTQKKFVEKLEDEILRAKRYKQDLTLLAIEVNFDYFQKDYDIKGTLSYTIFRQLGNIIRSVLRIVDIAGRYGGDNFVIILPNTDEEGALQAAERLKEAVEKYNFSGDETMPWVKVALSAGIATFNRHAHTAKELISAAQKGLQLAKAKGGNKVEVCPITLEGAE